MSSLSRKLSLLLAGILCGSVLASCNETSIVIETSSTTQVHHYHPPLSPRPPTVSFTDLPQEERILKVAYTEGDFGNYTCRSLKADELDESDVDVATRARDMRLLDILGLELELTRFSKFEMETALLRIEDYDILAGDLHADIGLAQKGYLLDLKRLPKDANYLDIDAPYWCQTINDAIAYNDAYYWITGDLALRMIGGVYCTYVNARIYNEKLIGTYGSIYNIVKEGQWTLDLMTEMAAHCFEDTGTIIDQPDETDTFGFGWESCEMIDAMAMAAGAQFAAQDPVTGEITTSLLNQQNFEIAKKLDVLTYQGNFAHCYGDSDSTIIMSAFASGTVAFTINRLFAASNLLHDMGDNYLILPAPKFDEDQETYISPVYDGCTIFGIASHTQKIPQCTAALEFLCAYSAMDVVPLYYEDALKGRYTREPEAATMIDLIHDNTSTDFAFAWSRSIGDMHTVFRTCTPLNRENLEDRIDEWKNSIHQIR